VQPIMIKLTLTSFSGSRKAISFATPAQVQTYIGALPNALPKSVTLQVECDVLGISGVVKGNK
jgi:hypothetical protein